MVMKKIKPQYGKVVPPAVGSVQKADEELTAEEPKETKSESGGHPLKDKLEETTEKSESESPKRSSATQNSSTVAKQKGTSRLTSEPNPFLQTKEIFGKARLTKVGYRVRTDFVEILDFIKKMKKNGYTLEAVLDDALAYYFENSEDGREAIKKAEVFYS